MTRRGRALTAAGIAAVGGAVTCGAWTAVSPRLAWLMGLAAVVEGLALWAVVTLAQRREARLRAKRDVYLSALAPDDSDTVRWTVPR